jgi:peptidoglycan hydrolase-like protein with peptidoglycan-binding domain
MLRMGASGEDVRGLQTALLRKGINAGSADGVFGPKTRDAVMRFQERAGLAADGIAGPQTLEALFGPAEAEDTDEGEPEGSGEPQAL